MVLQSINIGTTANDGTGDNLRQTFKKTESNFSELYNITNSGPFPTYTGFAGQCQKDNDLGWRYLPWESTEVFLNGRKNSIEFVSSPIMFTNGIITNLGIKITNNTNAEIGIYIDNTNPTQISTTTDADNIEWDFTQTLTSSGPNSSYTISPNLTVNTLDLVRVGIKSTTTTVVGYCYYTMQLTHS